MTLKWIEEPLKPPPFLTVWVMNGKKKCKAWWDPSNQNWYLERRDIWDAPELHAVKCWAEIPELNFKMQRPDKSCL